MFTVVVVEAVRLVVYLYLGRRMAVASVQLHELRRHR